MIMSQINAEHFVTARKETLKLTNVCIKNSKLTKMVLKHTSFHYNNKFYVENNGTSVVSSISDII
jgi:dsRNA-specific ribonuclease